MIRCLSTEYEDTPFSPGAISHRARISPRDPLYICSDNKPTPPSIKYIKVSLALGKIMPASETIRDVVSLPWSQMAEGMHLAVYTRQSLEY